MFFSITKVLSLCDTLKKRDFVEEVMQEVGFLFKNSDEVMEQLKEAIKVINNNYFLFLSNILFIELSRCYSGQR